MATGGGGGAGRSGPVHTRRPCSNHRRETQLGTCLAPAAGIRSLSREISEMEDECFAKTGFDWPNHTIATLAWALLAISLLFESRISDIERPLLAFAISETHDDDVQYVAIALQ